MEGEGGGRRWRGEQGEGMGRKGRGGVGEKGGEEEGEID